MVKTTILIATISGDKTGRGAGFFYYAKMTGNTAIPVIVSNRHVFQESEKVKIQFWGIRPDGTKMIVTRVIDNVQNHITYHKKEEVDLATMNFEQVLIDLEKEKITTDIEFLDKTILPSTGNISQFTAIEEGFVMGYLQGYYNKVNLRPFVRKGITASDLKIVLESSGSPVVIYEPAWNASNASISMKYPDKLFLVGVNSGVFIQRLQGDVLTTRTRYISEIHTSIGSGIICKSYLLNDFDMWL